MAEGNEIVLAERELSPMFQRCIGSVREDLRDNPYIAEAMRVLPVGGYRSAIGAFWNAVVDDLRNKIMVRSLSLFNKAVSPTKLIKQYEDFQNHINDDQLIDGAYAIGVIGWEASKVLKHAKETRHIFSGHPKSGEPSIVKVLAMMEDCVKYVLNAEYPLQIVDIDDYMTALGDTTFARNAVAVQNACGDLPEIYRTELVNRLFGAYVHPDGSTTLRSNIEFVAPVLWRFVPKPTQLQVVRRVDQEISKANTSTIDQAFSFVKIVDATRYLSTTSRQYKAEPLVKALTAALDKFTEENKAVRELEPYAALIPSELLSEYVAGLVHTYVGRMGSSAQYARTDFYADGAASIIPNMIELFDDNAADAFIQTLRTSKLLKRRIESAPKMRRLRSIGVIVLGRVSEAFANKALLELLVAEDREGEFLAAIR